MGQMSALFYKNWLLYKRGLFGNILELVIPIFFLYFIILTRNLDEAKSYNEQSFIGNSSYDFTIESDSAADALLKTCTGNNKVGLVPTGDSLITRLDTMVTGLGYSTVSYTTESAMDEHIRTEGYETATDKICFAIVVTSSTGGDYRYKLRFNVSNDEAESDGPVTTGDVTLDQALDLDLFIRTKDGGMLGANTLVNTAILQAETSSTTNYFQTKIAPIYQETDTKDDLYNNLSFQIGLLVLLPLLLIYLKQTSAMLNEKEKKIRESMSIMGMKTFYYYFSWFMRNFIVYFVMHLIGSAMVVSQLNYIGFGTVFILFLLFDIVLIVQNFFFQVFFTRAKLGVVISLLFFVLQFILSFVATSNDSPNAGINGGISVIPHAALVLAFQTLIYAESNQITPDFTSEINKYTLGIAILSFVLNIIIYTVLTWYLDQVVPNEWGAKKHPLFCCYDKESTFTEQDKEDHKRQYMESDTYKNTHEPKGENEVTLERNNQTIEIVGLRKEFDGFTAVEDLNLNMYNSQIFSLLGHNGAGKTTTISMLTGLIEPTRGHISVFGETELDKIRAMIGVCPQHDTLYEDLTVEEHLYLFGSFKGLEGEDLENEINKLIGDVNLSEKRQEYSKNLSGGQKRRLSVAIAFAGRSKVIILDEPTSGMDTSARRYIWQLLKTYKQDRIILLTTHFMDEADYLGDKIGIMGQGNMICCGSSIYLKNQFGLGYNITFSKKSNDVSSNPIIDTVKKHSPNAKVLSNIATDLSMQLPMEDIRKFPALFDDLDSHKDHLKYAEYGISITTLEEVFLRIGENLEKRREVGAEVSASAIKISPKSSKRGSDNNNSNIVVKDAQLEMPSLPLEGALNNNSSGMIAAETERVDQIDYDDIPRVEGDCAQFCMHFSATFFKRIRVIRRDTKSFCFELLLPIIVMIVGLLIMNITFITDQPEQTIDFALFLPNQNPVVVPIGSGSSAFVTSLEGTLNTKYGSEISVRPDTTDTTAATFDSNFLRPLKAQDKYLLGGTFYDNTTSSAGGNTYYRYNAIVNTRTPPSFFFEQTLAAQTILNNVLSRNVNITVTNHPLPRSYTELQINNTISGFLAGLVFVIALGFKFASIIAFIIKEREDKSKHQQLISGMKLSAYWLANFIYDYILYFFAAFIACVMIAGLQIESLTDGDAYGAVCILFVLFGISYIWFTYIFAFLFKDYGSAQAGYYFITFVLGAMIPNLVQLLRFISKSTNGLGRGLGWIFRLYPAYSFGEGLLSIGSVTLLGSAQNNEQKMPVYDAQIALSPIIYLAIFSILCPIALFVIQHLLNNEKFMRCCSSQESVEETQAITEDDVMQEIDRAKKADPSEYEILTKGLRKVFSIDSEKKHKIAVDNLSFTVKRGEVFGLLGINGAGKSTTFKMLSGELTSTAGDSFFRGMKISENLDKVRESLGYCPQFDALIETLTVREQLELFYDLKSLDPEYKERAIDNKIRELNLGDHEDKMSGTLSGGNKRKLSVAMAMIGNPKIVFLDEPSTGMDPKARRFMWKVISRVATEKENTTVILTTHSMEEAEALSSRLGIMVKGNFKCIGTPQHIKSKYGEGFEVEVKLNPFKKTMLEAFMREKQVNPVQSIKKDQIDSVLTALQAEPEDKAEISEGGAANYIHNALQSTGQIDVFTVTEFALICRIHRHVIAELKKIAGDVQVIEKLQSFMRLKVSKNSKISRLFEFFESNKEKLQIQQYTVKQATVEQIFNVFAESQEESEYNG